MFAVLLGLRIDKGLEIVFVLFLDFDTDGLREIGVGNGLDVGVDLAVEHINDAGSINGEGWVVCNHNNGVTFPVDGFQLLHDGVGAAGVEIAGGLIGENNLGIADDSSRDSNALLLATRKLVGKIVLFFLEMKALESIGSLLETVSLAVAGID